MWGSLIGKGAAEGGDDGAVGGEPGKGVDVAEGGPSSRFVLCEGEGTSRKRADKAVKRQMKVGVVVFDGAKMALDFHLNAKLFAQLTCKSLAGRLPRLDFTAGKLPQPFECAVTSLRGINLSIPVNDARNNFNRFHRFSKNSKINCPRGALVLTLQS